jgi:hypothetical protein
MGTLKTILINYVTVVTVQSNLLQLVLRFNLLIINYVTVVTVKIYFLRPP